MADRFFPELLSLCIILLYVSCGHNRMLLFITTLWAENVPISKNAIPEIVVEPDHLKKNRFEKKGDT